MRDISGFVNVHWYLGVPFNDSSNWRLEIVEQGQAILGDYLIGIQAGNEPDLYAQHQHRPQVCVHCVLLCLAVNKELLPELQSRRLFQ